MNVAWTREIAYAVTPSQIKVEAGEEVGGVQMLDILGSNHFLMTFRNS